MVIRRNVARALLRVARWRVVGEVPRSGIMVGAPHTSNWDWSATMLMMWSQSVTPRILIKQELFKGPLGWLLRATGGVPVDRHNASDVVSGLVDQLKEDESFIIAIAAEGTRTKAEYWKSGFYRLAQATGMPVSLGFIDGATRTVGFGPTIQITGDVGADMDRIRAFYADKRGLHPEHQTEPRLREELDPRTS